MPGTFRQRSRGRPVRVLLLALLALVTLPACRADVDVRVDVVEDGSGEVAVTTTFDAEAAAKVLDLGLDADGLPLADLAQSGWVVDPPATDPATGATVVRATKAFGTADQFADVMSELNGPDGPFSDFALTRVKRFARVDFTLSGVIDTRSGFAGFSDPALEGALGRSLGDIAGYYGATPGDVTIGVDIALPGENQGGAGNGIVRGVDDGVVASWEASLADNEAMAIDISTATRQVVARALRGLAVVAGVLAGLFVFARLLRIVFDRRTGRRPRPRPAAARPPASPSQRVEPERAGARTGTEAPVTHRWVAVDGMGVLFREPDDVTNLLIPFARQHGSTRTDAEIAARARWLRLGRITPAEFWAAIDVPGDPAELDAAYLSLIQLSPGVIRYLRALRERGLKLACMTNEAAPWAAQLRVRHSLESLIEVWVVSGTVGEGKPEPPIFEVLRRKVNEPPANVLVVDDDLEALDAARALGFSTAWYAPAGSAATARHHGLIRSFELDEDLVEM